MKNIGAVCLALMAWSGFAQEAKDLTGEQIDKKVAAVIADWETLPGVADDIEFTSEQIRELVGLGEAAVPGLISALDKTSKDACLRLIPFTLRAIDDPRAVPALIRNFPKTLRPPGSDYGLRLKNGDLLRFMQSHCIAALEGNPRRRSDDFDLGRPVREFAAALRKLTGTKLNEGDLFHTFVQGGEEQRAVQRRAFEVVSKEWADWWNANGSRFVTKPESVAVTVSTPNRTPARTTLITGSNAKVSEGMAGVILSLPGSTNKGAASLALNRHVKVPQELAGGNAEKLNEWAASEAVDLVAGKYTGENGKEFYALRGMGLRAWEVEGEVWDSIEKVLKAGRTPDLSRPANPWLIAYDHAAKRYLPEKKATFVFIARDGVQGILRVTAQVDRLWGPADLGVPYFEVKDSSPDQRSVSGPHLGVKFDYKIIYEETEALKEDLEARTKQREERQKKLQERKLVRLFEKHPKLSGVVIGPEGKPVVGASVLLAVPGEAAILAGPKFEFAHESTIVPTGFNGEFSIPRVEEGHTIYVAHESGFAEYKLADLIENLPVTIQLHRWGRIEGTIFRRGKLAAGEEMSLLLGADRGFGAGFLALSAGYYRVKSEADGNFAMEYVPPIEVRVCRLVKNTYYEGKRVAIAPGETARVRHGSEGRRVQGRFATSDRKPVKWSELSGFRFYTKPVDADGPGGNKERVNYPVEITEKGEFHVEDVAPGDYELTGELREGGNNGFPFGGKVLGRVTRTVNVPEENAAADAPPLDVGEWTIQMVTILKVGDVAPDFEVNTVNGQALRLAQFRGKYVLLDFWATWCGPCIAEVPHLKEAYEKFGAHPKFAMIGLSLDKEVEAPRDYAKRMGMRWEQAFLGDWSQSTVPARYGVEAIPATFLIDPEGKIIEKNLRGERLVAALEEILKPSDEEVR